MSNRRSVLAAWTTGSRIALLCAVSGLLVPTLDSCTHSHGAIKVASTVDGPWILTGDGALHAHDGTGWEQKEAPGAADDFEICGSVLFILTRPDAQGVRAVKSRDIHESSWTTYPPIGAVTPLQVACDGHEPVVLAATSDQAIMKYYGQTQGWRTIHRGATDLSVMNGRLFYLYPTTQYGNVWSRDVDGGPYQRWGEQMVAARIAGDANGFPWVAVNATSNPLYEWDDTNRKWTFGFSSGPVYDMDIQSYVRMYILSDPQISSGGYTLYSHDLYSGGWTKYSLPVY